MLRFLLVLMLLISSPAWAVTQWNVALPASGDNLTAFPAAVGSQWSILQTLVSNYRRGMSSIYKNSTTATVLAGECIVANSGLSTYLFLKTLSNTDITTANLDTGSSFSNSTTYYIYAGTSSATAASPTYYISLSSSAPTGVTYYFQIGSFTTDSGGAIAAVNTVDVTGVGNKVSKSVNTTYLATTDGYVEGFGTQLTGGTGSISCYTDASPTPSSQVVGIAIGNDVNDTESYGFRVKKGDYYKCTVSSYWSNGALYFVPEGQ